MYDPLFTINQYRLAMTELSEEKKQFIDDNFYETQEDKELDRQKFDLLTQSEELHYLADKHNWDDGVKVLQWIAESKNCSQATALQIFWLAQPQEFQAYKLTENLKDNDADQIFNLIKTIYKNYQENFYQQADIHFDPTIHIETEQQVPDFMKQPTNGEETYIYLDKSEVDNWFGEDLENKISRCDTTMELFNIASFTKSADRAKLILKHPLCDKGIAVLLFWRLKTFANMWYETSSMATDLIDKVRKNEYPEVVAYHPKLDTEIKMNEPKPKWTIPEIMKRPI